jgi:hypothetical protein
MLRYTFEEILAVIPAPRHGDDEPRQAGGPDPLNPPGPFDAFADAARWADLWVPAGFTLVRTERDGAELWLRPGDAASEYSVRCGGRNGPVAVVHSEAAGLPSGAGQKLTKGRVFAHLHHGGDESAAAGDLRAAAAGNPAASPAARGLPTHVLLAIRQRCNVPPWAGGHPGTAPDRDEDDFWTARPILDYIHSFARARRVAPWAALAEVLVRVSTAAGWKLRLPALIGGEASLAIYAALVGASGAGKGAATRAARAAVAFTGTEPFAEVNLGSGQGIAHAFAERPRPTKDNPKPGINLHTPKVLFTVPEVATLGALAEAKGSPLLPELTKAWMGEALGFMYVDRDKRLPLPELAYRLGLVVGVQPERAGVLLDDSDAGTPQRFIFAAVGDPNMPDRRPDCPPRWVWKHPVLYGEPPVVDVCATAATDIDRAHLVRQRAAADATIPEALDGHLLLCRLKVAAAFGLLDGRTSVSDEDWQLAGAVIDHSLQVRRQVVAVLGDRKRQANLGRAKAQAEVADVLEEAAEVRGLRHAEDWIIKQLTGRRSVDGGWMTARELSRSVGDRNKPWLRAALERLVESGRIEAEPTRPEGGGRPSIRYRMPR